MHLNISLFVVVLVGAARAHDFAIEEGFEKVTCGSIVKLANVASDYRLHSHEIRYGTGSGEQSVTGFPHGSDHNSYWVVRYITDGVICPTGTPLKCGSVIQLQHLKTKKFLRVFPEHSSPLSQQQEVSVTSEHSKKGFIVTCDLVHWLREKPIRLRVEEGGAWLKSDVSHKFMQPIYGQLEVAAVPYEDGENTMWVAKEGIYYAELEDKMG